MNYICIFILRLIIIHYTCFDLCIIFLSLKLKIIIPVPGTVRDRRYAHKLIFDARELILDFYEHKSIVRTGTVCILMSDSLISRLDRVTVLLALEIELKHAKNKLIRTSP